MAGGSVEVDLLPSVPLHRLTAFDCGPVRCFFVCMFFCQKVAVFTLPKTAVRACIGGKLHFRFIRCDSEY